MLQSILTISYSLVCFTLMGMILLQRGKDASGDLFGVGASAVLSSQGTNSFLLKFTSTLGALFFFLALSLGSAIHQSTSHSSLRAVLKDSPGNTLVATQEKKLTEETSSAGATEEKIKQLTQKKSKTSGVKSARSKTKKQAKS